MMTNGAILDDPADTLASQAPASAQGGVLRQIIARTRRPDPPSPQVVEEHRPPSPDRAASVALSRAAERLYGLPVFTEAAEIASVTLSELPELLPDQALLAVIGAKGDRLGVVALCPSVIAALIEIQAIGRLSSRPIRSRKPTRTDATIAADFVNALLLDMGRELAASQLSGIEGFSYSSYLDDPRPLMLMLEDVPMTRLTLRCRLGSGGQRDGEVLIAVPAATRAPLVTSPSTPRLLAAGEAIQPPTPAEPGSVKDEIQGLGVRDAAIDLVGVLCRKTLSLGMLRNLAPGDLIPLPAGVLDETRLETAQGQLLAQGRLGDADGYHAIRLKGPEDEIAAAASPAIDLSQPDAFRAATPRVEEIGEHPLQPSQTPSFGG